jgi:hypothetical protein
VGIATPARADDTPAPDRNQCAQLNKARHEPLIISEKKFRKDAEAAC